MTLSFPLTSVFHRDYSLHAAGVPVVWIGVQETRRMAAFVRLFYCIRSMASLLYGRVVLGGFGCVGTLFRYANQYDTAHPILIGEAENINRLKRSLT